MCCLLCIPAACKRLRRLGCAVAPTEPWEITGFSLQHGPHVVLAPNVGPTIGTLATKFPTPASVSIAKNATVILNGAGISVETLDVDGTLVVNAVEGAVVGTCNVDYVQWCVQMC
jgi:hypothetical protein